MLTNFSPTQEIAIKRNVIFKTIVLKRLTNGIHSFFGP